MNHKAWILHQVLVYSFTQKNTDLFADILTDKAVYGSAFLNIIQIKSQHLLRHFIASLLLSKNNDDLIDTALPVIITEKDKYSDSYTQFVEALYEDFDFEKA